jgi:hypothetical protein
MRQGGVWMLAWKAEIQELERRIWAIEADEAGESGSKGDRVS